MDDKHWFQSEDLAEETSSPPVLRCKCPLCTGSISSAPPVSEVEHIGDQRMVDPQLTDYEFSGYDDGEVVVVLRSRQMALQPIKLLTFSNPHALSVLIRALESVLAAHTNQQEFVEETGQDDSLMTLQEAAGHTGIPVSALEDAILLGDLRAYPKLSMNKPLLGQYMVKLREVPVSLKSKAEEG